VPGPYCSREVHAELVVEDAHLPPLLHEARSLIEEYARSLPFELDFQDFATSSAPTARSAPSCARR